MASRQVKKLLKQQDVLLGPTEEEQESEPEPSTAKKFNPFDLLDEEDGEQAAAAEQEDDEDQYEMEQQADSKAKAVGPANGASKAKSKKGKKKGSKGKGGSKTADDSAAATQSAAASMTEAKGNEDIDALLQELNIHPAGANGAAATADTAGNGAAAGTAVAPSTTSQLLSVDAAALRGDEELRRIFGASVIAAVDREDTADAANRRRMAAAARGRPGAAAALRRARRGLLVTPKDHWPPLESGIGMQYLGVKDGVRQFKYTWSPSYQNTQRAFEQCQASHDPNAIALLLQHAPYHVDALLAMYDLYRHLGENQYAEEVLLRALHALEVAWHPQFDIRTANCRLDFEVQENQGLFLALFKHVQGLSRAGCHRTALELSKLLLALQPEDPLGMTCMIDYLAMRAGRYAYLHQFVSGWEADDTLALRPNFAYALALSAFRMEQQQQQGAASSSQAGCDADAGNGVVQHLPAKTLLLHACHLHPSVVPRILAKLQEKGTGREAHWTKLLDRKLFKHPHDAGSTTLQHLSSIYVERSALLWKPPDALELLREVATRAADMADAGNIKTSGSAIGTAQEADMDGPTVQDWVCVRQEAFPDDAGRNEFRHLRLADFSDNVNALPREELGPAAVPAPPDAAAAAAARAAGGGPRVRGGAVGAGMMDMMGDVDPAVLEELQQQVALAQQAGSNAGAGAPAMSEEELRTANPLMMLLRSLLPWVNAGQQPVYGQDEDLQPQAPDE